MTKLQQKIKAHIIEDIVHHIRNAILFSGCFRLLEDADEWSIKMKLSQLEDDLESYRKRLMRIRREIKNMEATI
jgi:hypothetical protein